MQVIKFLPVTMRRLPQWVLWRLEDGKKIPLSVNYDGRASSTNPRTWCDYNKAVEALRQYPERYDGIGFVFAETDGLVFIDLDHCLGDGNRLEPFSVAWSVFNQFSKSGAFAEISQSGTGLHIVCRGKIPRAIKTADVEMYWAGRYVALTGNAVCAVEPADHEGDCNALYRWLERRRSGSRGASNRNDKPSPTCITLNAAEIIERAKQARGGDVFAALYAGEWKSLGIGDGSQSSADLSLANRLTFWCGGNRDLVEEIFESSGLYRNPRKMKLAVDRAMADCGEVYGQRRGGYGR